MVCIPFHTFVNTIRYKSNHPHNIIPEYAGCQYRKYILKLLLRYIKCIIVIISNIVLILIIMPNVNVEFIL